MTDELTIIKEMALKTIKGYEEDKTQESFNLLCLGRVGSGKTFSMAKTCRKPLHVDSFDRGGTKGLRDLRLADPGNYILETKYEQEDPFKPTMFEEWKADMDKRLKTNYFAHFGTYMLDSSTWWSEAIMNSILKKAGIAGQAPRYTHDYNPQKIIIKNYIQEMLKLPCDFILTGHLEADKDEVTGQITYRFSTTGKGVIIIPTLFDEIWVMDPKESSKGIDRRVLLQSTGKYDCRSRIAKDNKLDTFEPVRACFSLSAKPNDDVANWF